MATLPKGTDADAVTLDEAVALLAAKAGKGGGAAKGKTKKKASGKKPARKKPAASKPAESAAANEPNR